MDNFTQGDLPENIDAEATYRAIRDSILEIFNLVTRHAKESSPDNEVQVSWELGDTSLLNWISDTHCYLSRKGQKIQFLTRPSKLQMIDLNLLAEDKLIICSDTLLQHIPETELNEVIQQSNSTESSIQNIANIAAAAELGLKYNIVVMDVVNPRVKPITKSKTIEKPVNLTPKVPSRIKLYVSVAIAAFVVAGIIFWFKNPNHTLSRGKGTIDTNSANNYIAQEPIDSSNTLNDTSFASTPTASTNDGFDNETTPPPPPVPVKEEKKTVASAPKATPPTNTPFTTPSKTGTVPSKKPSNNAYAAANFEKELDQYEALKKQKSKWTAIRDSLRREVAKGANNLAPRLQNSEQVLRRIDEKMGESAARLNQ